MKVYNVTYELVIQVAAESLEEAYERAAEHMASYDARDFNAIPVDEEACT